MDGKAHKQADPSWVMGISYSHETHMPCTYTVAQHSLDYEHNEPITRLFTTTISVPHVYTHTHGS